MSVKPTTPSEVAFAMRRVASRRIKAEATAKDARREAGELVAAGRAAGMSGAEIAEALSLTRARLYQAYGEAMRGE